MINHNIIDNENTTNNHNIIDDENTTNNDNIIDDSKYDDPEVKDINRNIHSKHSRKCKKGTGRHSPWYYTCGRIQRRRQKKQLYKYDDYPVDCGIKIKLRNI